MTTLSPTMEAMLAELSALTKARKDNWNCQDQPINADLEAEHLREMRRLKAGISRERFGPYAAAWSADWNRSVVAVGCDRLFGVAGLTEKRRKHKMKKKSAYCRKGPIR